MIIDRFFFVESHFRLHPQEAIELSAGADNAIVWD